MCPFDSFFFFKKKEKGGGGYFLSGTLNPELGLPSSQDQCPTQQIATSH